MEPLLWKKQWRNSNSLSILHDVNRQRWSNWSNKIKIYDCSKFNLTLGVDNDENNEELIRKINFELGVENYAKNEKLIGRFLGDVNQNKELKNELNSEAYRWYFDNLKKDDIFTLWTPFHIDDNEEIDKIYKNLNLFGPFKSPNFFENDRFTIYFDKLCVKFKNDTEERIIKRKNSFPRNFRRIQNFDMKINAENSKNTSTILTEETILNI